jgi:hypothetical protein
VTGRAEAEEGACEELHHVAVVALDVMDLFGGRGAASFKAVLTKRPFGEQVGA